MAEETVILHFEVDQGAAERRLEKIEGILLDNKKAQQELSAAYKKGVISQEEYVKENIRLQQNIKKEQDQKKALIRTIETESNSRNSLKQRIASLTKEYDNLNLKTEQGAIRAKHLEKELSQLNSQLTKGDKAAGLFKNQIGNYPQILGDATKNINIAGVSVGDLATKFTAFANPATAAVGIIGALGAAYARSTAGGKDLAFVQSQLSAAITLSTNKFAELITSAEDGEGAFTSLFNNLLTFADKFPAFFIPRAILKGVGIDIEEIRKQSKELALFAEKLEDLGRLEQEIRINANQLLEDNQELLEQVADDQLTINQRLEAANKIEANLRINKTKILDVLNSEYNIIQKQLKGDQENEKLQDLLIAKRREISKESASLEKQITRINKQQDDLNAKLREEQRLREDILRTDIFEANAPKVDLSTGQANTSPLADPAIEASKARQEQFISELKTVETSEADKIRFRKESAAIQDQIDQQRFNTVLTLAQLGAALFGKETAAYKAFATASTLISTYSAATKAYEAAFLPVPTVASPGLGAAYAALAVAQGLANVAQINGIQFAAGGQTGPGFGSPDHTGFKPAGYVHEYEYVVPKHVNLSPAAQPHIAALESMRMKPYADGGFVTNQSTAPAQQAMITANALKNLPPVYASWTEGMRVGKRVEFKQERSTL